jgi:hypothetical protein
VTGIWKKDCVDIFWGIFKIQFRCINKRECERWGRKYATGWGGGATWSKYKIVLTELVVKALFYRKFSYRQRNIIRVEFHYNNQLMQWTKYIRKLLLKTRYVFQHLGAIFSRAFDTKECRFNTTTYSFKILNTETPKHIKLTTITIMIRLLKYYMC